MKRLFLIIGLLVLSNISFGQVAVDSLVQKGIKYHDNKQYDKAIEVYKEALLIEPNSALANYEIALTYMYTKDYDKAIMHSDKVIELDNQYSKQAYVTKGSCLDHLGKTEDSIKLFEKGIRKFGDDHLLYYNLGYNYYKIKNYKKAEAALISAINTKSDHTTSHLLLGYLMKDSQKKVQSLLCLHYFLLLEPNTTRGQTAYKLMRDQFGGNVKQDPDKPNQINIFLDSSQSGTEFGAADLMISMLEASKTLEENNGKTEDELFIENTTSFFNVLGELKKKKSKGLWWEFYVPFFYSLAKSEHIDTYCYYISKSSNDKAVEWLQSNDERVSQFNKWLIER